MDISYAGKTVIVTGASAGIGKAIAGAFLENGANVLLVGRSLNHVETTFHEFEKIYPGMSSGYVADVSQAHKIGPEIVKAAVDRFGGLDVLVNNAGIYPSKYSLDLEEEDWDRVFDLNVKGYFFMAQAAARYWVKNNRKGSIVNITSGAAQNARPGAVPYTTSKAAVVMLTHGLALEWIRKGIHVNAVGPGLIETEALLESLNTEEARNEHKEKITMIPINRTGLPGEIAQAVLFMASDKAEFIVGQNLFVDGGYTAGRVFKSKQG